MNNIYSTVIGATPEETKRLWKILSFVDTTAMFERDFRSGKNVRRRERTSDGRVVYKRDENGIALRDEAGQLIPKIANIPNISLLEDNGTFPTGLAGRVMAKRQDMQIKVIDDRKKLPYDLDLVDAFFEQAGKLFGTERREYQVEAAKTLLKASRGILDLATGSGKSLLSMSIVAATPGTKWLFIVPSVTLFKQIVDTYEKFFPGEKAGKIRGPICDIRDFTVSTPKTLKMRLDKGHTEVTQLITRDCTGLMIDEVHRVGANEQYFVAMSCNAYWRVGLSGTPLARGDGKSIKNIAAIGKVIDRIRTKELIDAGVLAQLTITLLPVRQTEMGKGSWQDQYSQFIAKSETRMRALIHLVTGVAQAPGMIFCIREAHGKWISAVLSAMGIRNLFIWGKSDGRRRAQALQELEDGKWTWLVVSTVFDVGVDAPWLRSGIFAGGRKAEIEVLQRLGRLVRKDVKTGKTEANVYDLFDEAPSDCPPSLVDKQTNPRHSLERLRLYRREGHKIVKLPTWNT